MPYANRVNLQGYLEIVKVTTIEIDGKTIPVLYGYLHSGDFLAIHKLVISDYPATKTINLIKEFQEQPNGQALLTISNHQVEITVLDGKPLVSIEGKLFSFPNQESVIDVQWITFLSLAPLSFHGQDALLMDVIKWWMKIPDVKRKMVHQYLVRLVDNRNEKTSGLLHP